VSDYKFPEVPKPPKVPEGWEIVEERYRGLPEVPEVEDRYREAYRALQALLPLGGAYPSEGRLGHVCEVIREFRTIVREAELAAAAELGPVIGWYGDWPDNWPEPDKWQLVPAGLDLDDGGRDFGADLSNQLEGEWTDGPLSQAATAYQRECGWDSAPGPAGLWLVMLARVKAVGTQPRLNPKHWPAFLSGNLIGFAIMYDQPEGVSHVWTARAWRRQKIASRLLDEARSRFGSDRPQGPFTRDGAALRQAREDESR
jgi:ribosomal protein S18 acetylase RimI-like enzyme